MTHVTATIKPYKKKGIYSYSIGIFPPIELLLHRPDYAVRMLNHHKGTQSEGVHNIKDIASKSGIKLEYDDKLVECLGGENAYAIGFSKSWYSFSPFCQCFDWLHSCKTTITFYGMD